MEKISPLEDTLLIAVEPSDKAAVYRTYLDLEINEFKDPARIQALYERVVADLPLYDVFWIDYCKFVDRQLKSMELTFAIYHRAVRNCPWNGPLWADYMYAAERYQKDGIFISGKNMFKIPEAIFIHKLHTGIVEKAFNAGLATAADLLAVWMRFIVQFVRKCKWDDDEQVSQLREVFTRAENHLFQSKYILNKFNFSLIIHNFFHQVMRPKVILSVSFTNIGHILKRKNSTTWKKLGSYGGKSWVRGEINLLNGG